MKCPHCHRGFEPRALDLWSELIGAIALRLVAQGQCDRAEAESTAAFAAARAARVAGQACGYVECVKPPDAPAARDTGIDRRLAEPLDGDDDTIVVEAAPAAATAPRRPWRAAIAVTCSVCGGSVGTRQACKYDQTMATTGKFFCKAHKHLRYALGPQKRREKRLAAMMLLAMLVSGCTGLRQAPVVLPPAVVEAESIEEIRSELQHGLANVKAELSATIDSQVEAAGLKVTRNIAGTVNETVTTYSDRIQSIGLIVVVGLVIVGAVVVVGMVLYTRRESLRGYERGRIKRGCDPWAPPPPEMRT